MIALAAAALAGTVDGTVRDPDGRPVAGVVVAAVDPHLVAIETTTDDAGTFRLEVPPGVWRIRATPPEGSAEAVTWAPSAGDRCDADLLRVDDGPVAADVTLLPGGEVRGVLLRPDGAPAAGASVTVHAQQGGTAHAAVAGADGAFAVRGVPEGPFVIALADPGVPDQYWGGAYGIAEASAYAVAAGAVLDLGQAALRAGVTVRGTVSGPDGPVSEGTVGAYAPSQIAEGPIGPDGRFEVTGVPSGDVLAWATAPGFATTYWPSADRPAGRVPVEDGEEAALDLLLPYEAVLRGRVLGEGPWDGATAVLYNSDRTIGIGAALAGDGTFTFGGLHGGTYTLWLEAGQGGRVTGELAGADGEPLPLEVPPEGVLDLGDLDLPLGAAIRGRITDAATGAPIAAAYVLAEPEALEGTRSATTGPDGSFALEGLAAGAWSLWVGHQALCASDPGWVTLWYRDTPNPLFAAPLVLGAGDEATWEAALPPDHDHDGMDDRWEAEHGLDPTVDDGAADPDGDGFDNLEEYLLGTDPTDADERRCGCGTGGGGSALVGVALVALRRRQPRNGRTAGTN